MAASGGLTTTMMNPSLPTYAHAMSTHTQSDVYLNDLAAVEFGQGADFTLAFDDQTSSSPLQLAALSQALRDEIVWSLLTVRVGRRRCGP